MQGREFGACLFTSERTTCQVVVNRVRSLQALFGRRWKSIPSPFAWPGGVRGSSGLGLVGVVPRTSCGRSRAQRVNTENTLSLRLCLCRCNCRRMLRRTGSQRCCTRLECAGRRTHVLFIHGPERRRLACAATGGRAHSSAGHQGRAGQPCAAGRKTFRSRYSSFSGPCGLYHVSHAMERLAHPQMSHFMRMQHPHACQSILIVESCGPTGPCSRTCQAVPLGLHYFDFCSEGYTPPSDRISSAAIHIGHGHAVWSVGLIYCHRGDGGGAVCVQLLAAHKL